MLEQTQYTTGFPLTGAKKITVYTESTISGSDVVERLRHCAEAIKGIIIRNRTIGSGIIVVKGAPVQIEKVFMDFDQKTIFIEILLPPC